MTLTSPVAAQSPSFLLTPPLIISQGPPLDRWTPEPAFAPTLAVTDGGGGVEKVHVLWATASQSNPITEDVMWYAGWTGQPWPPPTPYIAALGSTKSQLAVGPQNHLHAAFLTYRPDNSFYDADYVERLSSDDAPFPPPENDPQRLLFPTSTESDDVGLAVSTGSDGLERGHLVWSEYSGGNRTPPLYYGRAHREPTSLTPTGDAMSPLGAAGCLDTLSSPDCYRGYRASVAVVDVPGGSDKSLVVVWEGRDLFAPLTQVIYSGTRRLCPSNQTCLWTPPQPVSDNQLNKTRGTRQACSAQDPQPALRAIAPSVALSPRGTLHAIWFQQRQADGPYYVHMARLVYDDAAQDFCWDYYETITDEPAPTLTGGIPPERPHLAFDQQGRRYAVWNAGFQRVVVATSDLDAAASSGDHDVYAPWQMQGAINSGACTSPRGVRDVSVATKREGAQFVHVAWTVVNPDSLNRGRICYARLGYGYQTFMPRIQRADMLGH